MATETYITKTDLINAIKPILDALVAWETRANARFASLGSRMETLESKVGALESKVDALDAKVGALESKVDKNHQTVMDAIAEANKAQMDMLESMKDLGRSPNY